MLRERARAGFLFAIGGDGSEATDEEELGEGGKGEDEGSGGDGLGGDGEGWRWGPDVHGLADDPDGGGGYEEGGVGEEQVGGC